MNGCSGTEYCRHDLKKRYAVIICLTAFFLALWGDDGFGEPTAAEKGLEIAREADRRDLGWQDMKADVLMELKNRSGQTSVRELRLQSLEQENDGDKVMMIFDHPKDVKGTAFLSFTHCKGPDDQWLYLPALKRVKRISSDDKSGPFMGSEFAYEDLTSQEVEKYSYKYLRDEPLNGLDCFVVERYPVDPKSGYTRQIVWCDKSEYRIQKCEFYDRKDVLLKTLEYIKYQQYMGRYWRADVMHMANHQTGKETTLTWKNLQFQNGYTERDFGRNSLENAR